MKFQNNNIIYAPSYQTLVFALSRFYFEEVIFVTRNKSIAGFCKKVNIECFYFKEETSTRIKKIIDYKNYIKEKSSYFSNCNIYFFFHISGISDSYFIKCLNKRNKVYFKDLDLFPKKEVNFLKLLRKIRTLKWLIFNMYLYRYIYRVKYQVFDVGNDEFLLGTKLDFIEKNYLKFLTTFNKKHHNLNIRKISKQLNFSNIDILYINNYSLDPNYVNQISNILNNLIKKGFRVAIKPHPKLDLGNSFERFKFIDKTIPVELICELNEIKMYVGDYSAALNFTVQKRKTIAFIKLIKASNKWINNIANDFLNKEIEKPSSEEEVINLITSTLN